MANTYFQFKQFRITQQYSAMKVTTDGCLFGAWVAEKVSLLKPMRILDIGTGTGLLSLMLAQKEERILIEAVEIDNLAAAEAKDNFTNSPWKDRLNVIESDIKEFSLGEDKRYDFIVSNPPFFDNDLKSNSSKRNLAMHSQLLSLEELLAAIKRLLNDNGSFTILLPCHRTESFERMALEEGFYLKEKVLVKQTPLHSPFRSMLLFTKSSKETVEKEISIKESDNYTSAFSSLLKDYYLYL